MDQPVTVDRTHEELVDPLAPPTFAPSGPPKTAAQAIADGDWLGSINIWLYSLDPEPSIIYQLRAPTVLWEPNKLDLAGGGHYSAGESGLDGLRELQEELGITIPRDKLQFFGPRLLAGVDAKGRERKWHISVYVGEYAGTLEAMTLQEEEVYGVFKVPLKPLMQVFHGQAESLEVVGKDAHGNSLPYTITLQSFPYNFDDYQRKMAEFIALKTGVDDTYLSGRTA